MFQAEGRAPARHRRGKGHACLGSGGNGTTGKRVTEGLYAKQSLFPSFLCRRVHLYSIGMTQVVVWWAWKVAWGIKGLEEVAQSLTLLPQKLS